MRVYAFLLLAFAACGALNAAPLDDDDLADAIQKLIDQLLSKAPNIAELKDVVIDIPKNKIENGVITIKEISLTGLKKLDSKLKFDKKSSLLNYTLNYGDLVAVVDYTVSLQGLINAEHHLSAHVDLNDLNVAGFAEVALDDKEIKDLDVLLTLKKSTFDIKGLLNNDELSAKVSKTLTENVALILDTIDPILAPYFSKVIKDLINVALKALG